MIIQFFKGLTIFIYSSVGWKIDQNMVWYGTRYENNVTYFAGSSNGEAL